MSRPPSRLQHQRGMPPPRRPASALRNVRPYSPNTSMLSTSSMIGHKRKEREFDEESANGVSMVTGAGATNINVFVRCRGRNDREVRENSGVVVTTDGVKGTTVDVSMGQNSQGNKTYYFDQVFSPAADQIMIFDEVVVPILDEVMRGFNCTIFAYGQTGTGKTYTMSGDIADQLPLPDGAGIIPRVLHALFGRLDSGLNSPTTVSETDVKVSFVELYNEELRDLLAPDESIKLKIFDGDSKKGHSASWIQGAEETHIGSYQKGIELLQRGSYKRQVAATKCNDLSSRSHTVFTIQVLRKSREEGSEEYLSAGKLNLVDLAGSENIQRSGAENKRAAEAGLINKSLLTLGRVINALVDKQAHIPYRESKLTRLLQDSLGGRTKTCIIATISPAKSNLEETISTLDYAFRAKNIRNKPQISQVSKKGVLKDLAVEIEKLKSELIATRSKNGVYLTQQAYDELTNECESQRTQVKEQREKIETAECNLKNKLQEIHSLTTTFKTLKEDNEMHKKTLQEEVYVRQNHERTEEQLAKIDNDLIGLADQLSKDIKGLYEKLDRRSYLHSENRQIWSESQGEVSTATALVEGRLQKFQNEQQTLMDQLSTRMQKFIKDEVTEITSTKADVERNTETFEAAMSQLTVEEGQAKEKMNSIVTNEIASLREEVKQKVGAGLDDLKKATERISAGIMTEIEGFHMQLHSSYASLGRDVKTSFDDVLKEMADQREQIEVLKSEVNEASSQLSVSNGASVVQFNSLLQSEKTLRDTENQNLLARIQELMDATTKQQDMRMQEMSKIPPQFATNTENHVRALAKVAEGQDQLVERSNVFEDKMLKSRDTMKAKIQGDFAVANQHADNIKNVTASVHEETYRIVTSQLTHLDAELRSLDIIASRIQQQNNAAHASRESSLTTLSSTTRSAYSTVSCDLSANLERVDSLMVDMGSTISSLQDTLPALDADAYVRKPLIELRAKTEVEGLKEYVPTGTTPARKEYVYPHAVPRTEPRDVLVERLKNRGSRPTSSDGMVTAFGETMLLEDLEIGAIAIPGGNKSPSKGIVFTDVKPEAGEDEAIGNDIMLGRRPGSRLTPDINTTGTLREIDLNVNAINRPIASSSTASTVDAILSASTKTVPVDFGGKHDVLPPLKRLHTTGSSRVAKGASSSSKKRGPRSTVAGNNGGLADRENLTMPLLSASVGHGSTHPERITARRLRSHERTNTPT